MSFEETEDELATNVASLHFDLKKLEAQKKILIEHVHLERSEIQETGAWPGSWPLHLQTDCTGSRIPADLKKRMSAVQIILPKCG